VREGVGAPFNDGLEEEDTSKLSLRNRNKFKTTAGMHFSSFANKEGLVIFQGGRGRDYKIYSKSQREKEKAGAMTLHSWEKKKESEGVAFREKANWKRGVTGLGRRHPFVSIHGKKRIADYEETARPCSFAIERGKRLLEERGGFITGGRGAS